MKVNLQNNVNNQITKIHKSIATSLKSSDYLVGKDTDTAQTGVVLTPPVSMRDCKYVFDNSSYVAKCCRILAKDIILNKITLVNADDPKYDEVVSKIQDNLVENIIELYNMLVDYYYAPYGAIEYATGKHRFKLKQIPVNTTEIIKARVGKDEVYLLKQHIQSTVNYFRIMGEEYPPSFSHFDGKKVGDCCLMGGDNFYQFFATPLWVQERDKIFTEIAISNKNYNTIANGNLATGILNINLEPQIVKPVQYDENGDKIIQKPREETIAEELTNTDSGIAVVFTESNRPITFDFTNIENSNYEYLENLQEKAEQAVLNCYNIPLARLMINTEKESMNSNKTQSIWEIYTLDLKTEQSRSKEFLKELVYKIYEIKVEVEIEVPIFSDRREIEINNIINQWQNGLLTLRQTIEALAEYTSVIDLNNYDFTQHPDLWDYRQIQGLYELLNEVDLLKLDEVENEINALSQ